MTKPLSAVIRGTGPGLVLVHGAGGSAHGSWGPVLGPLSADFTVVAPNNPGSADMPIDDGPLRLDAIVERIVATVDEVGLGRFVVVAQSMGAAIAVRLTTRHPERVRALVLVAGFGHARNSLKLNLSIAQRLYVNQDPEFGSFMTGISWSARYLNNVGDAELLRLRTSGSEAEPGLLQHLELAGRLDVRSELSSVRAPTLVIATTQDRFVSPDHSDDLASGIDGALRASLDTGHAFAAERPGEFIDVVTPFLGDVTARH